MLIVVVCVTMLIFVELPPPITEEIECIYTYTMIIKIMISKMLWLLCEQTLLCV